MLNVSLLRFVCASVIIGFMRFLKRKLSHSFFSYEIMSGSHLLCMTFMKGKYHDDNCECPGHIFVVIFLNGNGNDNGNGNGRTRADLLPSPASDEEKTWSWQDSQGLKHRRMPSPDAGHLCYTGFPGPKPLARVLLASQNKSS